MNTEKSQRTNIYADVGLGIIFAMLVIALIGLILEKVGVIEPYSDDPIAYWGAFAFTVTGLATLIFLKIFRKYTNQ